MLVVDDDKAVLATYSRLLRRAGFEAVTAAVNRCMKNVMAAPNTVVLVVKYLNVDPEIGRAPSLTP